MSGSTGMDVVWQEGVGSFLDSSGTDLSTFASFTSDDGGALWSSSGDSPLFSGQPVLWESGADAPADSHISALTADSANGTDTSALLAGSWIADAGAGFAGGSAALGSLLWAGAGGDTSSTLSSNGGVGLGALDLGASSGASQWFQSLGLSAPQETWLPHPTNVLWTGASSQPQITVPVLDGSQLLHAASDGSALPTLGSVAPTQLVWTPPEHADLSFTGAAPTTPSGGAIPSSLTIGGVTVQHSTAILSVIQLPFTG